MNGLNNRLDRVEEKLRPPADSEVILHVHFTDNPRQDCELCRAMTDEEYERFENDPDVRDITLNFLDGGRRPREEEE